jgi:hypothetical protein
MVSSSSFLFFTLAAFRGNMAFGDTQRSSNQRLRNPGSTTVQSASISDVSPADRKFFAALAEDPLHARNRLTQEDEGEDDEGEETNDETDAMAEAFAALGTVDIMMSMNPTLLPNDVPSAQPSGAIIAASNSPTGTIPAPTFPPAASPVTPAPVFTAVTPAPVLTPVAPAPMFTPVTPAPVFTPVTPAPVLAPVTPPVFTPVTPTPVLAPVTPAPAPVFTPVTPTPVLTPVTPTPVLTPVTPTPVLAPVTPAPVFTPVTPTPVLTPVTPAPVLTPVTPAPVLAPVTPAPVFTPVTPTPVLTPVTPAPVFTPVAPAPVSTPVTLAPVFTPVTPVTLAPVFTPVAPPANAPNAPVTSPTMPTPPSVCQGITDVDRVTQILAILDAVANPNDIRNNATPEGLATTFLIEQDALQVCPNDPNSCQLIQRWSLAVIYYSTGGDNWFQCSANPNATDNCGNEAPFIGKTRFLSGGSECNWAGIACVHGCVTYMQFGRYLEHCS